MMYFFAMAIVFVVPISIVLMARWTIAQLKKPLS